MSAQPSLDFSGRHRPQTPYWATTPLTRDQMIGAIHVAEKQDEIVMAIFRAHTRALGPSQVHEIGLGHGLKWLPTSVRRSITNLTNAGVLVHLREHRDGPHGRPEGLWALPGVTRA